MRGSPRDNESWDGRGSMTEIEKGALGSPTETGNQVVALSWFGRCLKSSSTGERKGRFPEGEVRRLGLERISLAGSSFEERPAVFPRSPTMLHPPFPPSRKNPAALMASTPAPHPHRPKHRRPLLPAIRTPSPYKAAAGRVWFCCALSSPGGL